MRTKVLKYVAVVAVMLPMATIAQDWQGQPQNGPWAGGLGGQPTPASVIHPGINNNVGDGSNANPNGANANGGQLHGIANAQGGNGGVGNLGNVHGGISSVNKNVN